MADKSELPNIKVLRSFRGPEGIHVPVGAVFPKSALDKGDWSTLVNMTPPRAVETDDRITDGETDDRITDGETDDRITDGETAPKRTKKAEEALLPTA